MDAQSRLIAKRYALAYFDANKDIEEARNSFIKIYDLVISYLSYFKHPCNPCITSKIKIQILSKIIDNSLKGTKAEAFFKILIEEKRISLLPVIRSEVEKLYDEKKGIERIKIYSRFKLSDRELEYIKEAVSGLTDKKLIFEQQIKQDLIGGFQAQIGDFFLDASISGRLKNLTKSLLN